MKPEVRSVIEADHVLELEDLEAKKPAAGQGSSIESDNLDLAEVNGNQWILRAKCTCNNAEVQEGIDIELLHPDI